MKRLRKPAYIVGVFAPLPFTTFVRQHRNSSSVCSKDQETRRLSGNEAQGAFSSLLVSRIHYGGHRRCDANLFFGFLHCVVVIGVEPMMEAPLRMSAVRVADVSPHSISVSWITKRKIRSTRPSPFTSRCRT